MRILFCGLLTLATSILGSAQAAPKLTTIYDFKGGDYPRFPDRKPGRWTSWTYLRHGLSRFPERKCL